jgi:hemerythrin superfamily protein
MTDALVLLKADHKAVEKLFKKYEGLGDSAYKTKRKVVDEIVAELSIHAAVEEQVFYPAVRTKLPDIEDDVLEGLEEHHVVKWTLDELKDLPADHERFHAKVTVLIESVRHHVEEEETEMFPAVRQGLGRKELAAIGAQLEDAKRVAPSKPHPKSPDTPPGNLVAGPAAASLDKVSAKVKKAVKR